MQKVLDADEVKEKNNKNCGRAEGWNGWMLISTAI